MKLTRLELRNWWQHECLDIDFPSAPIIRLCWPNNAGKSNIIRAIGRALAQGGTDFEQAPGLRYGTNSGSIRLCAMTHEHLPFAARSAREGTSPWNLKTRGWSKSRRSPNNWRLGLDRRKCFCNFSSRARARSPRSWWKRAVTGFVNSSRFAVSKASWKSRRL